MSTVLVTGATGYIGSHACVALLDSGHDVVGIDNFANSSPLALERIEEVAGRPMTFVEGDLIDRGVVADLLERPAHAQIAHDALGEGRNVLEGTDGQHGGRLRKIDLVRIINRSARQARHP